MTCRIAANGLSPPTRGNHQYSGQLRRDRRSIPAHAGEPASPHSTMDLPWSIPAHAGEPGASPTWPTWWPVYPRPRGGTAGRNGGPRSKRGLSPPTRGNLVASRPFDPLHRSIPAHAGEPRPASPCCPARRVYPRPRGGTCCDVSRAMFPRGLSPPTRGNRATLNQRQSQHRSIPAHAGEPCV